MGLGKALFLDRDGTIIIEKDYLCDPDGVELVDGAQSFLKRALEEGYELFLFTNQSGIGRGYYTIDKAHACNTRLEEMLGLEKSFKGICIAPEHPDEPSEYRKPSPKFILESIESHGLDPQQCWMIGDKLCDVEAGVRGGVNAAWVPFGKPMCEKLRAFIDAEGVRELKAFEDFWD